MSFKATGLTKQASKTTCKQNKIFILTNGLLKKKPQQVELGKMAFNITFKTEALKCTTGSKTSKEPCGTNI